MNQGIAKLKTSLRLVLPLALGLLLLWLLYQNLEWKDIEQVLRSRVNYTALAVSLIFGLVANTLRGLRWHLLVQPIVPRQEARPRLINAIATVLGSYTINMGIPRAGELWRCAEYKRREGFAFSELFGTLINDRLADIFSLFLILSAVVLAYRDFFLGFFSENPQQILQLKQASSSPWLYIAAAVAILLAVGVGVSLRRSPQNRLSRIIRSVLSGIASIRAMKQSGLFICYSVLIWACYFLAFYTTFFAFPFTKELGPHVALIAFAMSSLSALAPVQAGMGPWHFMVITTLVSYGISRSDAGVFALIVHTTQTLWITLVGLIAILALPAINRGYTRQTFSADTTHEAERQLVHCP